MERSAVISALSIADGTLIPEQDWQAAQQACPAGGPLFLDPASVAGAAHGAYLPQDVQQAAVAAARRVVADPALRAFAWYCYYMTLGEGPFLRDAVWRWPLPTDTLGKDAGLFYLLVLLSGMPRLRAIYRERAIPDDVARATLYDVQRSLLRYRKVHGVWGFEARRLTWLRNHLLGQLYQLGRLQHQLNEFHAGVHVFRHGERGTVVALSEDGIRYRADGQYDGAGGVYDPEGAWTARLVATPTEVTGSPVVPQGHALRHEVRLSLDEWQPALVPGDPVLQLHIPDGSPMDYEQCGESFRWALEFFPRHFPEHRFRAFACSSWLLDAQLQRLLPPTSNLARFQREVYLLPAPGNGSSTLTTVFGSVPDDLSQAPRHTTLQRALIAHLAAGGHARSGRCFLLREDVRWGSRVYLSADAPLSELMRS